MPQRSQCRRASELVACLRESRRSRHHANNFCHLNPYHMAYGCTKKMQYISISNVCVSTCQPGGSKWHQHAFVSYSTLACLCNHSVTLAAFVDMPLIMKACPSSKSSMFSETGNLNTFYALFPLPQKPLKHLQTYTTNRFVTPTGNLTTNPKVLAFLFPQLST